MCGCPWGLRHAPFRPPTRGGRCPWSSRAAGTGAWRRTGPSSSATRRPGGALRHRAHGDARRRLLPGAHAGPVPRQGPEGLAGVPRSVRRARPWVTDSRCAASSSRGRRSTSSSPSWSGSRCPPSSYRGRGRTVPRAGALPQAEDPHVGAGRDPEGGTHDQSRGAGGLQPGGPGLPDRRGIRAVGPA